MYVTKLLHGIQNSLDKTTAVYQGAQGADQAPTFYHNIRRPVHLLIIS